MDKHSFRIKMKDKVSRTNNDDNLFRNINYLFQDSSTFFSNIASPSWFYRLKIVLFLETNDKKVANSS